MSYYWSGEGERQYNEMLLQVQQQFLEYRESTTNRLEQIEQMVEFAVQKLKSDTSASFEQFKGVISDYEGAVVFDKDLQEEECDAGEQQLILALGLHTQHSEGPPVFDEDPNEEDYDLEEQKIILAALGIQEVQAKGPLQFTGINMDKQYKILIDGGSTLSLISIDLCEEMRLLVQPQTPITMKLPNGTSFTSAAVCPNFKLKWKDTEMAISTHVADLKQWHLFLGVDWLAKLGDVKCSFSLQTIQFTWKGQEILLTPTSQLEMDSSCYQLTEVVPRWLEQLEASYERDMELQDLIARVARDKSGPQEYYLRQGLLMYRGQTSVKTPTLGSYDMEMGMCQRKAQGFMYVLFATKAEVAKLEDLSKEQEGPKVHRLKVTIYIFDPGGKKLEGEEATMRAWLIFKRGGLSGNDPD